MFRAIILIEVFVWESEFLIVQGAHFWLCLRTLYQEQLAPVSLIVLRTIKISAISDTKEFTTFFEPNKG